MKKPILIIAAGVVVISLLLFVNEKWLKETSAPKTADNQQKSAVERQGSQSEKKKTTANPTSKPLVFDLTKKAHWYDPETTMGYRESYQTLAKWLEPFKPDAEEFQIIAQHEEARKKLEESISEDEYYSPEGRMRFLVENSNLKKQLREQLGEERSQFYFEVRDLETGYYDTWKVLTVNGISEARVSEFRELADEFNQQMHGIPLYRAERNISRYVPDDWNNIDVDKKRIAKHFQDRIEKEFGRQVLADILSLHSGNFFWMTWREGIL